ncbi:MAG: tryptophan-rich sensory protein [Bacteroidota bacterium]|nr:tryptophan-rich sensory protein [Bacteroidota bacterium]
MKRRLQISNAFALVVTIAINYISNTGIFNGNTISSVSAKYNNLLTPASYAFSIWGLIYLCLTAFVIYQGISFFKKENSPKVVLQIGWWFVISCAVNCLWIFAWLNDYIGISVVLMIILLFSLLKIIINTRMELDDPDFKTIGFVWWPFSIYSGWVTIALIVNVSAYLTKIQWDGFGFSNLTWAIIMVCIAGVVNIFMTWKRNMREFGFVGVWALIAIGVANIERSPPLFVFAIIMGALLFISSSAHAYINREYAPCRIR